MGTARPPSPVRPLPPAPSAPLPRRGGLTLPLTGVATPWWRRCTRIFPMSMPFQHERNAFSIASPERITDTPQTLAFTWRPV